MPSLFLVTLFALFTAPTALAGSSCIAFDAGFELLAFGFGGKDYNVGTSDQWASGKPTDITASGRPPFDGTSAKCYLAQFFNCRLRLGADKSNPASQSTTPGGFDPTSFEAILRSRHQHLLWVQSIFDALSKGELWSLDMKELVTAGSSPIVWQDGGAAEINTSNYDPVMAIAQNHIFFFGVPGVTPGNAPIFVIHFGFWQEGSQSFSSDFPDTHGQTTSFFLDSGVQEEIAFVPDDGSHTYIINVQSNTTQTIAGPSTVDAGATYFASTTALVQLAANGALSYLPYSATDKSANSAAKWAPIAAFNSIAGATPGGGSSSGGSSAAGGSSSSGSAKGGSAASNTGSGSGAKTTGSPSGSAPAPSGTGAATRQVAWGSGMVMALVAVGLSLL
ncbi:hypothetical protein B0H14DRAFT_2848845 [Mycena olivaceomarginata]|nr:hypothetical protein B0H14DRAFT_2848845 [Mycena olivaceomarginata]